MVTDIHRKVDSGPGGQHSSTQASFPVGESPPPAPRACFGREEVIENVVGLAENLEPIALIGAGGIGKTSIALYILHHARIKERFGIHRRFIRCDRFPTSLPHFLARLSKVTGAVAKNPEDLAPLRPLLASTEMLIVLDNAESILDPQGNDAREIYNVVDELSQFDTICLCITSRITTVPRCCKQPEIPMLLMGAAREIFYGIYHGERSDTVNDLLERLDFHALSITLLATTASHNRWDHGRLEKEWNDRRAQVLQTDYNESLAATVELSLTSPTFCRLGPDARELLGIVAFFPRGINESNIDWLFPTVPDLKTNFDKFCALSLTYRTNNFLTMLEPLREYLRPQDPKSSHLLCAVKDNYFSRLSADLEPDKPGFREACWIVAEDSNVEHLVDVFTSIDAGSVGVWDACYRFMDHLYWHKPRKSIFKPKINALPDDHPSKPACLYYLSQLFLSVGDFVEQYNCLYKALELERERGGENQIAKTLVEISMSGRMLGFKKKAIQQVNEALEIYERLGDKIGQARCLKSLAWTLFSYSRLDAAEDAAFRAIDLAPEKGEEFLLCESHHILGDIYRSKGKKEEAILHLETAVQIASPYWNDRLVWIHYSFAELFLGGEEFDDATGHIERAKSHAAGDPYRLARLIEQQARIWHRQKRFEDATSEILRAKEVYENLALPEGVYDCDWLRSTIEREKSKLDPTVSGTPPPSAAATSQAI